MGFQKDGAPRPSLGTINVIFAASGSYANLHSRILAVASNSTQGNLAQASKRAKLELSLVLGFLEEDKSGTFHPHEDALVVTLWIRGYDVKRVLVD